MYLRRISLRLVGKYRPALYKFPVLQFVEETSKILLLNEIQLVYWYHLMKTYLTRLNGDAIFTLETVRLFFFESAMFVKKFLLQRQMSGSFTLPLTRIEQANIDSIEAYIKTYHYSNFDKVYSQFDRED